MPDTKDNKTKDSVTAFPGRDEDDEPDEWDKRIYSTGCAAEQTKMNDCYFDKKDWRVCANEMQAFRECWKQKGNDQRTLTKNS